MRLGFFQGEAADKSLSRIYPVLDTGSRILKSLVLFEEKK